MRLRVDAALAVLDRFMMTALNAGDEAALLATPHFPHYRLTGGRMRVWDRPGAYLGDFLAPCRRGLAPRRDFRRVIAAGPAKSRQSIAFPTSKFQPVPAESRA